MLVRISYNKKDVVEQGEDYVTLKINPHQSPTIPAWICTFKSKEESAKEGRYLNINQRGGISVGPKH